LAMARPPLPWLMSTLPVLMFSFTLSLSMSWVKN
jgi:hypothetical protein